MNFNKYKSSSPGKVDLELLRLSLEHGETSSCRQIIYRSFKNHKASTQDILGLRRIYRDIILLLLTQFAAAHQIAPRMLETELLLFSMSRFSTIGDICVDLCAYCEDFIHSIIQKRQKKELADMVCDYIEQHYMDEMSLQNIADYFFISPNYLCNRFKEKKQNTIGAYLEKVRMEKACGLLSSTSISISEVSRLTGYNDVNYFSRIFKKCYAVTPSQYRKKTK